VEVGLRDVCFLLPEITLGVFVVVLLGLDLLFTRSEAKVRYIPPVALLGLLICGATLCWSGGGEITQAFTNQLAIDPLGRLFKCLFIAITAVCIFTSVMSKELPRQNIGEYLALLLAITLGMFLMASANDFLLAYLGVEMVSIVSYALAGYRLRDRRSSESALKYVIYGGVASGLMLFGISMLYGLFGTTEFTAIHHALLGWETQHFANSIALGQQVFPLTMMVALCLVFAGVGYKIAVVPFHMWSPDVYEGAPTPFTGFLSVGPKAAGFALLMRLLITIFVSPSGEHGFLTDADGLMRIAVDLPIAAMLGCVAVVTMTFGNLAAIAQNNVKRLLAYSSIAHAGYILVGLVVLSEASIHAVIFYLVLYYFMNLGAFTVCQYVRDRSGGESLEDFRGLGEQAPLLAISMTIFLVSLTGLPPVAGFIGKFYLFAAVIQKGGFWYIALAVAGVLNSSISLFYYFNITKAMWLREPLGEPEVAPVHKGYTWVAVILAVPTLVLGLYWAPVSSSIREQISIYRAPVVAAATAQVHQDAPPKNP
jgi:NADH-quinone oxidoreductase subunit N